MFGFLTASVGSPHGLVSYFSLVFGLLTTTIYTWIIKEEFNFLLSWGISNILPAISLIITYAVLKENGVLCFSLMISISLLLLIINFACLLNISFWLEMNKYTEDSYFDLSMKAHYDFINLFLGVIDICRRYGKSNSAEADAEEKKNNPIEETHLDKTSTVIVS
jgi:hypothetical protein